MIVEYEYYQYYITFNVDNPMYNETRFLNPKLVFRNRNRALRCPFITVLSFQLRADAEVVHVVAKRIQILKYFCF